MKVDITFSDLTAEQAATLTFYAEMVEAGVDAKETMTKPEAKPEAKPAKRKRRTKAEIAADRAEEEDAHADEVKRVMAHRAAREEEEKEAARAAEENRTDPPRRRRNRGGDDEPEPARRAPKKTEPDDNEISDADVAKAASEGAQKHTPKVVSAILEEFGVGNVADLDQEQRLEFMTAIDDYEAE